MFPIFLSLVLFPIAVQPSWFVCSEEGRFPDPDDCSSFIECVPSRTSRGLVARRGTCSKGSFHPLYRKCVGRKEDPTCHSRSPRMDDHRMDLQYLCTEGVDFVCADCSTVVHCTDGEAFSTTCSEGDMCSAKQDFAGGVCYPEVITECTCVDNSGFMVDFYNSQLFYWCDENGNRENPHKCSDDMFFDVDLQQCVNNLGLPPCTQIGVFADTNDCSHYYTCIQSEDGFVQRKFTCPMFMMYSEVNERCEDPCNWIEGEIICEEEGRFRDKTDCQAFFECISQDNGYRITKRYCPSSYVWEQAISTNSGSCVRFEDSECDDRPATQCSIPFDMCVL